MLAQKAKVFPERLRNALTSGSSWEVLALVSVLPVASESTPADTVVNRPPLKKFKFTATYMDKSSRLTLLCMYLRMPTTQANHLDTPIRSDFR